MASQDHHGVDIQSRCEVGYALRFDNRDELSSFRDKFHIPTTADLWRENLLRQDNEPPSKECVYLCGNALGLQPTTTLGYVKQFLTQWRTKAVAGHSADHRDATLAPFSDLDDQAAKLMAPIVGAAPHEVAVMGTLTANLHLLFGTFYKPKPEEGRYKVLLEDKAFPSDHFVVESQIEMRGYSPSDAMIFLKPDEADSTVTLSTEYILQTIDAHAHELSLIFLPAIQYYTGQYFDIQLITAHAHSHGIVIGWDCAHAAGNVDLKLHDWGVDFAAWCTYKYMNAGPGAIAAIYINEEHTKVDMAAEPGHRWKSRLTGWWGHDKETRFETNNEFVPRPGAAGFQLSTPSALDMSAIIASLKIFKEAGMDKIRTKSTLLTAYLHFLLITEEFMGPDRPYTILTPSYIPQRGAQLSIRLETGLWDTVRECLEDDGIVIDKRQPKVIKIAPAPLYNTFHDVYQFCDCFRKGLRLAMQKKEAVKNVGDDCITLSP